jgi:hypothetical protein
MLEEIDEKESSGKDVTLSSQPITTLGNSHIGVLQVSTFEAQVRQAVERKERAENELA